MTEIWVIFFWIHSSYNKFICRISQLNSISWIQNIEVSSIFSNEFILWFYNNELELWNQIHKFRLNTMNSYIWMHILMNSCMNSESICLNSYTWIHEYSYIYSINEFISYMNSWVYEFIQSFHIWFHIMNMWIHMHNINEFIYMNSYKLWIHMIFS